MKAGLNAPTFTLASCSAYSTLKMKTMLLRNVNRLSKNHMASYPEGILLHNHRARASSPTSQIRLLGLMLLSGNCKVDSNVLLGINRVFHFYLRLLCQAFFFCYDEYLAGDINRRINYARTYPRSNQNWHVPIKVSGTP